MRLELPDGIQVEPLFRAMRIELERQNCHLVGLVKHGELTLAAVPVSQDTSSHQRITVQSHVMPGAVLLEQVDHHTTHNNVIPITSKRAARRGNTPPRAA